MHGRVAAFGWGRSLAGAVRAMVVVGALVGAGCSGADSGADARSDTGSVDGVGDVPTTTSVVTTTAAPTTTTTDAPSISTTTTTLPPTTTTVPAEPTLEQLEAEVAAAYEDVYWGYWACLRAPLACDVSWLEPESGSYRAMVNTMQALVDRDRFVGDDDVGYYVIESIEFSADLTEAIVVSCWWSTAVLYTTPADPSRPAGADNPPTIVNDTPGSSTQSDVLVAAAGRWVVRSSSGLESFAGENRCES